MATLSSLLTMTAALVIALIVQLNSHSTDMRRSPLERSLDLEAQMAYARLPRLRDVRKSDPTGALLAAAVVIGCVGIAFAVVAIGRAELLEEADPGSWPVYALGFADLVAVVALAIRALAVGTRERASEADAAPDEDPSPVGSDAAIAPAPTT
jgi:hypothetical protein